MQRTNFRLGINKVYILSDLILKLPKSFLVFHIQPPPLSVVE